MVIEMNDEQLRTLTDLRGFLDGTVTMDFTVVEDERYAFIARTVKRFGYGRLNRADKAVVLRFLERVSGYSRQQISRVVKPGSERRAPAPNNRPGYLRVDSVHQSLPRTRSGGDQDGLKGVYHINAVDCVTPYAGVATGERISEAFLIPVLEALLQSFPFVIQGVHTDNAQAESKNGAIVRKHLGYSHIPQRFATPVNDFCRDHLNPYSNFHRPCLFAELITDARGRQRKRYPYALMMTPDEKLTSLPQAQTFLKPGITFAHLDELAGVMSDNTAAERLNEARSILFKTIFNRSKTTA